MPPNLASDHDRFRLYLKTILAAIVILYAAFYVQWLLLPGPKLLGNDFVTYYAASELIAQGRAADAYDVETIHRVEKKLAGFDCDKFPWHYPPSTMLLIAPLARLPYPVALALWLAVPLVGLVLVMRLALPHPLTVYLTLAAPAVFTNLIYGQNGYLTAALLGGGLALLGTRPALAGALLGLLTYKPHLAFLAPLALVVGGEWKVLRWWLITVGTMVGTSLIALGWAPWTAFFNNVLFAVGAVEAGSVKFHDMPTVSSAVLLAGGGAALARAAQAAGLLVSIGAVVWSWRRVDSRPLKNAVLVAATLLAAPHAYRYDLVLLLPGLAWLAGRGLADGWLPGERLTLIAAALLSFYAREASRVINLQPGPIVVAALLAYALVRCGGADRGRSAPRNNLLIKPNP